MGNIYDEEPYKYFEQKEAKHGRGAKFKGKKRGTTQTLRKYTVVSCLRIFLSPIISIQVAHWFDVRCVSLTLHSKRKKTRPQFKKEARTLLP
jgi:hypothetical protein